MMYLFVTDAAPGCPFVTGDGFTEIPVADDSRHAIDEHTLLAAQNTIVPS